jgi:hypothetical protein
MMISKNKTCLVVIKRNNDSRFPAGLTGSEDFNIPGITKIE